jgi:hypothetical protein
LVLIVDWCRHRAPIATDVPQMRQFTKWAQQLGGFLAHIGVPGFLTNHEDNRDQDEDANEWAQFLHTWHHIFDGREVTARDLCAYAEPEPGRPDPWQGTFPTTPGGRPLINTKSLGKRLTGQTGRWRGDIVLRSATDKHTKVKTYWVELEKPPNETPQNPQNPQEPT